MTNNLIPEPEFLEMPDADVVFYQDFFDATASTQLYEALASFDNIVWEQQSIVIAGQKIPFPRLTAWYGDEGNVYSYSGVTVYPHPWTPLLLGIKERVEDAAIHAFNSVLLNFYRDEKDSVSWHSDDEPELGANPVIASVSLGATRSFQFKHKQKSDLRAAIELTPGSLLIMRGATQHFWKHQIPKTKQPTGPRINLTFRVIVKP